MPDPGTFQVVPWRPQAHVARMFCSLLTPDGQPSPGDCRFALRRALGQAADLGYQFQVGAEVEFFLFEAPDDGDPGAMPVPLDDGAYFDLTPLDGGSVVLPPVDPDGVNVEFVTRTTADSVRFRVYERGSGETRSCAELTPQEKNAISHRGTAFRALVPTLVRVLGG